MSIIFFIFLAAIILFLFNIGKRVYIQYFRLNFYKKQGIPYCTPMYPIVGNQIKMSQIITTRMKEAFSKWDKEYLKTKSKVEIFDLMEQLVTAVGIECVFGMRPETLYIPWISEGVQSKKPIGWAVNSCLNELF